MKLTENEKAMMEKVTAEFDRADAHEMKRWNGHIHCLNQDTFLMGDKYNRLRKALHGLIDKGLVEIYERTEHMSSFTKAYNFGRVREHHSFRSGSLLIVPANWPYKKEAK